MPIVYFAWATSFLYGVSAVIAKITSNTAVKNPWLYNFIWTAVSFLFTVPFALYFGIGFPGNWKSMILLGATGALSGTAYIMAMTSLDVSILSPFFMLRTPIIVLLGYILYGENFTLFQLVLIGLMIVSGMIVSLDEKFSIRSIFRPQIGFAVASIMTSALFNISVKHTSIGNSYWDIVFWSGVLTLLFILPTYPLFRRDVRYTHVKAYSGIVWSTLFGTAGLLLSFIALKDNVGITSVIISLPFSMIMAIGLSVVAPKLLEKHPPNVYAVRVAAAALMFYCAIRLS